jgi:DNA-binding LacI/PurR family transcriptional regulator
MGQGPVRLREVAEAAGVSHGTASNVFNRPEIVREEVRERVLAAAERLGYGGPSPMGRLLRAGKANAIGIAAGEPLEYFFTDAWARTLLGAVSEACDARGAGLALVSMAPGREMAWNIESALVDGFVLLCGGREHLVEMTRRRGLPFVALSLDTTEPGAPAIDIDDLGGALEAGRHLTALGHERVAILGIGTAEGPVAMTPEAVEALPSLNVRRRAGGYWAALAEIGMAREDMPIVLARADRACIGAAMEMLFAEEPAPTAVLAMSDRLALGAMDWLAARGIRVPGDVSVLGFDGTPGAAVARPGLTTVAQPFARIAERAVTAILEDRMPTQREILPLSLIVRGSTGPCRGSVRPGPAGIAAE